MLLSESNASTVSDHRLKIGPKMLLNKEDIILYQNLAAIFLALASWNNDFIKLDN